MKDLFSGQTDSLFRGLLESAPDAMVIANQAGEIVLVNAQAVRLFGYARSEMLGQPVELLVPARYRDRHARHRGVYFGAAHPRGMGAGLDLFGQRKDGSEFPVEISLSPLQTDEGLLVASAIRDISDRRAAEAERERLIQERAAHAEASRIKDEFIATLSHELRTPLNAILGWASLLQDGAVPPEKTASALSAIVRNARAQIHLVEDLLDVSRIVAGKLTLQLRAIDFADVVSDALQVVRPSAEAKAIAIEVVFEKQPLILIGDPDRLQQAVWNVLSNAVKFSEKGGRVEARAWTGANTIYFTVRDAGRGIDPQFLSHVFDRFRQADSSYTREHGGLGLGLAIVRSIVELHGGSVKMASSGRGHGATVMFELPSRAVESTRGTAGVASDAAVQDLRDLEILVVDDQADERELMSTILSGLGARIATAASVGDALLHLEKARPSLLMTDIAMPGADGYVLLRRVREAGFGPADLPAVAVTAHARIEDRERAEHAGFQAYLSKPIDRERLQRVLADVMRRARAESAQPVKRIDRDPR